MDQPFSRTGEQPQAVASRRWKIANIVAELDGAMRSLKTLPRSIQVAESITAIDFAVRLLGQFGELRECPHCHNMADEIVDDGRWCAECRSLSAYQASCIKDGE